MNVVLVSLFVTLEPLMERLNQGEKEELCKWMLQEQKPKPKTMSEERKDIEMFKQQFLSRRKRKS